MESKEYLKKLILEFEDGKINFEFLKIKIQEITNKQIDENTLHSYYGWTSLDNFCELLVDKPIEDWREINDERAKFLISELLNNEITENIFDKNDETLEKKYGKSSGFLHNLIFWSENLTENEILEELKKDKKIYL